MTEEIIFDPDVATSVSEGTFAPIIVDWERPPRVHFEVSTSRRLMTANPPGASIYCEGYGRGSLVRILDTNGAHIADVTVHTPIGGDETEETIAIATAIYWSWWRAEAMHGRLHK